MSRNLLDWPKTATFDSPETAAEFVGLLEKHQAAFEAMREALRDLLPLVSPQWPNTKGKATEALELADKVAK